MAYPETGLEWVELVNSGPTSTDLTGYYLEDQLTSPSLIHTFTASDYLSAYQSKIYQLSSAKLNNSGDGVTLKNAANQVIDQVSFGVSTINNSWHRQVELNAPLVSGVADPGQVAWLTPTPTPNPIFQPSPSPENSSLSVTPTLFLTPTPATATLTLTEIPTPTQTSNSTISPTPFPTNTPTPELYAVSPIHFNEIVACADDRGEWVELYNPSQNTVNLNNWTLEDATGNTKYLSGLINPQSLLVFSWSSGLLNNSGDKLKLIAPNNQVLEEIYIPACRVDSSYALINNLWQATNDPTYGLPNIAPVSPAPSITPTPQITSWVKVKPTAMPSVTESTKPVAQNSNYIATHYPLSQNLALSNASPTRSITSTSPHISQSPDFFSPNLTSDQIFPQWLGVIMSGLLISTGGLFLTHVPIPIQLVNFFGG